MPEREDSAILFFKTFLGYFPQEQRGDVEDKLVEAAKNSRDVGTLRAVVSLEQARLEATDRTDPGSEEIWLTAQDLVRLGGYSYHTVAAKLASRSLESRPKQRRPGQKGKPAAEYRVNLKNCTWFDKGKRIRDKILSASKLPQRREAIRSLQTRITELEQQTESPSQTPPEEETGRWMTAAEIRQYGSPLNQSYLGQVLRNNPRQFQTKKRGRCHDGFINYTNCHRVGISPAQLRQLLAANPQTNQEVAPRPRLVETSSASEPGRWMTAAEIKNYGSPLNLTYIGVILGKNPDEFQTRRRGKRTYEGLITPENCSKFKIPRQTIEAKLSQPSSQAEELVTPPLAPSSEIRKVRFANGNSYELDSAHLYDLKFVQQVMANLGPQFKGEDLEALFKKVAVSKSPTQIGVPGNTLFGLLQQASQVAFLGEDFYTYFAAEAGVNTSEVRGLFNSEFAPRAKYLAGNLFPYVPRHELETLVEDVRENIHGVRRFSDEVLVSEQPKAKSPDEIIQERRREKQQAADEARRAEQAEKQASLEVTRARESSKVNIEAGGLKCTIYPGDAYPRAQAETMIRQIHPSYFGPRAQAFVSSLDSGGNVPGKDLIKFLETFRGGGILDPSSTSARQTLERDLGVRYEQILEDPELSKFVQRPAQDPNSPYILRSDLGEMRKVIEAKNPVPKPYSPQEPVRKITSPLEKAAELTSIDPETVLIDELSKRLGQYAPKNKMYENLRDTGVFQLDSPAAARRTAAAFAEAMHGWKYFNFYKFRESLGVADWQEFQDGYMSQLIEAGIVKDLVQELGVYENPRKLRVHVIKKEISPRELFEFFGLPVPATRNDPKAGHFHGG